MTNKILLWIAGSQVIMELNRKVLEHSGYSVRCAYGIAGAHEWLAESKPDGIIVEKELPDGNGLVYCCELRKICDAPILFMSSSPSDELIALQSGANDFLKKPYRQEIMVARINVLIKGACQNNNS